MLKHFNLNANGRDFFVGDIHGCFYLLDEAMLRVDFDERVDRLFSVGDLIDRGEFSEQVADWLVRPYFHAVRGNHEQTLLDAHAKKVDEDFHRMLGGDWWYDLDLSQSDKQNIIDAVDALPLMLSVDTAQGVIGLVHAEVWGYDWVRARQILSEPNTLYYEQLLTSSLWRRSKILHNDRAHVSGADVVAVGHTPVQKIQALGNVVYLDTGVGYSEFQQTVHLTQARALFDAVSK
ncbi:MAG: serine/threonine protein phosphatase [Burkholderiaceae bacterium]|nr:serine/threonine protein phosphatase [Burkholderiaceae bacterium]